VVTSAALAVLALVVTARWSAGFDEAILQRVRPGRVWEARQEQLTIWPRILSTTNTMAALMVVAGLAVVVRRSWRPLAIAAMVIGGIVGLTLLLKVAVPREDPALTQGRLGSFPSGHMAACCALFVTASLATAGRVRWWSVLLSAVVVGWMGYVMVMIGMHWTTDCVGGVLVTAAVVSAVMAFVPGPPEPPDQEVPKAARRTSDATP